jgi:hypothetical protein
MEWCVVCQSYNCKVDAPPAQVTWLTPSDQTDIDYYFQVSRDYGATWVDTDLANFFNRAGEAFRVVARVMSEALRAFEALSLFSVISADRIAALVNELRGALSSCSPMPFQYTQPAVAYKTAGSPYGNNTRGKKRWLLEQKQHDRILRAFS